MTKEGIIIVLLPIVIIVSPLLVILSLNTLFPSLMIEYSFSTWAATLFLTSILRVKVSKS